MVRDIRIGNYFDVPRKEQSPFYVYDIDIMANKIESEPPLLDFDDINLSLHPLMSKMRGHPLTWSFDDLSGIPFEQNIFEKMVFHGYEVEIINSDETTQIKVGKSIIINFINDGSIIFEHKMVKTTLDVKFFHELQNWLKDNYTIILRLKDERII